MAAPGNDDKVAGLPSAGYVVQLVVSGGHARQSVLVGGRFLYHLDSVLYHRVYLRIVFLHVALRELKQRTLGLLHQVVDVGGVVEGLGLYDAGKRYELSGKVFLGDDASVILDVGRRGHARAQLGHIYRATHLVEVAVLGQLFGDGEHVDRALGHAQVAHGGIHLLVARLIEAFGVEHLADHCVGVFVNH